MLGLEWWVFVLAAVGLLVLVVALVVLLVSPESLKRPRSKSRVRSSDMDEFRPGSLRNLSLWCSSPTLSKKPANSNSKRKLNKKNKEITKVELDAAFEAVSDERKRRASLNQLQEDSDVGSVSDTPDLHARSSHATQASLPLESEVSPSEDSAVEHSDADRPLFDQQQGSSRQLRHSTSDSHLNKRTVAANSVGTLDLNTWWMEGLNSDTDLALSRSISVVHSMVSARRRESSTAWRGSLTRRCSQAAPEGSVSDFGLLLADEKGVLQFSSFLNRVLCGENLAFYLTADKLINNASQEQAVATAREIVDEYVAEGAPAMVNLGSSLRTDVEKALEACEAVGEVGPPLLAALTSAKHEVHTMMERDLFMRFLQSEEGQSWCRRFDQPKRSWWQSALA